MGLFFLNGRNLTNDYQIQIVSGELERDKKTGALLLNRGGPYVAPITVHWIFGIPLVTDSFRALLEPRFPELKYREVVKQKIVALPWETWDFADPDPWRDAHVGMDGEPGDYLWLNDHSPEVAASMPTIWEVVAPSIPMKVKRSEKGYVAELEPREYRGIFTYPKNSSEFVVDRSARDWLRRAAGKWVSFEKIRIAGS